MTHFPCHMLQVVYCKYKILPIFNHNVMEWHMDPFSYQKRQTLCEASHEGKTVLNVLRNKMQIMSIKPSTLRPKFKFSCCPYIFPIEVVGRNNKQIFISCDPVLNSCTTLFCSVEITNINLLLITLKVERVKEQNNNLTMNDKQPKVCHMIFLCSIFIYFNRQVQ